jgi:hypothetical protein
MDIGDRKDRRMTAANATAARDRPVPWSEFTRNLGLSTTIRQNILSEGLVRPVEPPHQGRPTMITPDDAERVRAAVKLAALAGIAAIVILRLLAASGGNVSGSVVTIPLPPGVAA